MTHYVGLDVSVKSVSICVVDAARLVLARGDTTSDPNEITAFIAKHAPAPDRIVHESGILAFWVTRELKKRGLPITCIDARLAHEALSGKLACAKGFMINPPRPTRPTWQSASWLTCSYPFTKRSARRRRRWMTSPRPLRRRATLSGV